MWDPSAGQPGMYPPGAPMPPSTSGCPGVTNPIHPPSTNPAYPPSTFPTPPGCFPGNPAYPPSSAFGPGKQPGYPGCPPPGPYPLSCPGMPSVNPLAPGVVGPDIVMDKKMRKMKKAHKKMHKHHKHGKHSSSSSSSSRILTESSPPPPPQVIPPQLSQALDAILCWGKIALQSQPQPNPIHPLPKLG
ncbi:LOW QUALITY PROTEIN: proline-rich protein 13-like [Dromiciops gliroides]|uniref:LOW QUALITY PROTEIN: proline-rich protein 13-like n=1 Tax=Dromiciops gliroides TaxID=33562 RepID=UPI001CC587BD|nr:LOW QUALITY PROTEIN: proline-rich protein 13-like [Dromiciops gliroides]